MKYHMNFEPEANRYVTEDISIMEVPVEVIDNRTDKQYQFVFFLLAYDNAYSGKSEKIRSICDKVGFTVVEIGEPMLRTFDAGRIFLS